MIITCCIARRRVLPCEPVSGGVNGLGLWACRIRLSFCIFEMASELRLRYYIARCLGFTHNIIHLHFLYSPYRRKLSSFISSVGNKTPTHQRLELWRQPPTSDSTIKSSTHPTPLQPHPTCLSSHNGPFPPPPSSPQQLPLKRGNKI